MNLVRAQITTAGEQHCKRGPWKKFPRKYLLSNQYALHGPVLNLEAVFKI